MPAEEGEPTGQGQRDPRPEDLAPLLELIWSGKSLRKACAELGLHVPSTSDWLHADRGREEQYARARDGRAEYIAEDAQDMARAAATKAKHDGHDLDPAGVRVYLDAAKWNTARMSPKTAPREHHVHTFENLSDEELDARIAAMEVVGRADTGGEG
jgi:hypothetical protein